MTPAIATVLRRLSYLGGFIIILLAFMVSASFLLSPILDSHREDFEKWASNALQMPVKIRHIKIGWQHLEPEISFQQVTLAKDAASSFQIKQVNVNIAIFRSLLNWKLLAENIVIRGINMTVRQVEEKKFLIEGLTDFTLTDNLSGGSMGANELIGWIVMQPHLSLRDINIQYIAQNNQEKNITVSLLKLKNTGQYHHLLGDTVLHQEQPSKAHLELDWFGDIRDMKTVTAHAYLYVHGVSLLDWVNTMPIWHNMQIKRAVGSAKIWATWRDEGWQQIKTTFKLYHVQAYFLTNKKIQEIARISGNLSWQHTADKYIIRGDNVLIDLPDHLWPMTGFSVTLLPTPDGQLFLTKLTADYLDLGDVTMLLLASDWLPIETQKLLTDLNPKGVVQQLQIATKNSWTLPDIIFNAGFGGVTVNPINLPAKTTTTPASTTNTNKSPINKTLPGVKNFSGKIHWNGIKAFIEINSDALTLTMQNIFANPLFFNQVIADMVIEQDLQHRWQLTSKNLLLNNADLHLQANLGLLFPESGLPWINLMSNFKVNNAGAIATYLPVKFFNPELVYWLQIAFLHGQIDTGTAVVQGNLADFPFAAGNGKFVIKAHVSDLDFRYAPNWPVINHFGGDLTFGSQGITIDMQTGEILGLTVGATHSVIPIAADKATILTVESHISGDLAQALNFIHQSPLQNTLGKSLSDLRLSGPMQLKLNLAIPLKKLADTAVQGDVQMTHADLNLPEWKINLTQLNGNFQFSEKDVVGKNLQGFLWGEPATLNFATIHEASKPTFLRAELQGQLNPASLQSVFNMSLIKYIQGILKYTAEIRLYSVEDKLPTTVTMRSDLQGVSVNLPAPYNKESNMTRPSQLDIVIAKDQPLKARINYGSLFSFAANLKKTTDGLEMIGGNFSLGREALWPTESGFWLSGQLPSLDWDTIQGYFTKKKSKTSKSPDVSILPDIRGVDLDVGSLTAWGQHLTQVRIQISKNSNGLQVALRNEKVVGQLYLPHFQGGTIQARFQRLYLDSFDSVHRGLFDPYSLPAFSFVADDMRLGDKILGRVGIEAVPGTTGLIVNALYVDSPLLQVRARGQWTEVNHQHNSVLSGNAYTNNVSQLLAAWGFPIKNLIGSKASAQFALNWPSPLYDPTLPGLSGNVSLQLAQGRILSESNNTQLGIGRMLNIFSLNTLPRRLSGDFSDLFQKGYSFDTIQGDYTLANGNAYTKNMRIEGPVAKVAISGRIGYVNKDVELLISVTPYVTSSLPVVAAAVATPIAGVATYLLEKLVTRGVSKVVTHNYSVTGSWDNPVWNQLGKGQQSIPAR